MEYIKDMDWSKEVMLNLFMDFVLGEIDEIENVFKLANPRNHPDTSLNKIRQRLIYCSSIYCYGLEGVAFGVVQGMWAQGGINVKTTSLVTDLKETTSSPSKEIAE